MKFAASYSGGKDSIFAIYRAIQQGHMPILLLTTYNVDRNHSYSHALPEIVLHRVSESLGIPLLLIKTTDADYAQNFENALAHAKSLCAEACVFGDIDIEGHRIWCSERCENVGLASLHPLWGEDRKHIVYECIDSGFVPNITVVNTNHLSSDFLGQTLSRETADRIAQQGADICGEHGEYHTFVSAGPLFKQPVRFSFGAQVVNGEFASLPIQPE